MTEWYKAEIYTARQLYGIPRLPLLSHLVEIYVNVNRILLTLYKDLSWPPWQSFMSSSGQSFWPGVLIPLTHYNDIIMSAMASQITSLTIIYSTVYSRRRSKKTPKLRVTGLCEGNSPVTGEFPGQRASNAESVSIWWRHHVLEKPGVAVVMIAFRCELSL